MARTSSNTARTPASPMLTVVAVARNSPPTAARTPVAPATAPIVFIRFVSPEDPCLGEAQVSAVIVGFPETFPDLSAILVRCSRGSRTQQQFDVGTGRTKSRGVRGPRNSNRVSLSGPAVHPIGDPTGPSLPLRVSSHRTPERAPARSGNADLLHESHEVVEQPFLGDLPGLIPRGDGAELDVEAFVGRRDDFAFGRLHGSLHRPVEVGDGAGVIALREQDLVRPVDQMVVREDLEKLLCLGFVIMSSPRGIRLSRPVHRRVLGMPLPKNRPVLLVPRIVQC